MRKDLFLAIACYLLFVVSSSPQFNPTDSHEDKLRNVLMSGYNPAALPSQWVKTRISFTVLNFDMDEPKQAMDLNLWVHMTWSDPRLAWAKSGKFIRIKTLAFPADSVWKPDITLYNHAEPRSADPYIKTQVLVKNDGNMTWVPPAHIKASCSMDMTYWPHDIHNCSIKFGSWVHSLNTIDMFSATDAVMSVEETKTFIRGEWKVTDSGINRLTKRYACCPNEYVSVKAWLIIERIAPAYAWMIQAPAIVLGIFTFVIFLLPPSSLEKIIFGGFTLILDFCFLIELSQIIHYTSDKTPLIVKYVSKQLILTSITLIVSVIAIHITRFNYTSSFPDGIKKLLKTLSKVLYINDPLKSENRNHGGTSSSEKGIGNKDSFLGISPLGNGDWMIVALVVDRICLLLFAFIFFINLISYSSIL